MNHILKRADAVSKTGNHIHLAIRENELFVIIAGSRYPLTTGSLPVHATKIKLKEGMVVRLLKK